LFGTLQLSLRFFHLTPGLFGALQCSLRFRNLTPHLTLFAGSRSLLLRQALPPPISKRTQCDQNHQQDDQRASDPPALWVKGANGVDRQHSQEQE
jgi:hypothetical protein